MSYLMNENNVHEERAKELFGMMSRKIHNEKIGISWSSFAVYSMTSNHMNKRTLKILFNFLDYKGK